MSCTYISSLQASVPGKSCVRSKTHGPGLRVSDVGHRYYSAGMGRWASRDPVEEQDANLVRFCDNNSINLLDAHGDKASGAGGTGSGGTSGSSGGSGDTVYDRRFEIDNVDVKWCCVFDQVRDPEMLTAIALCALINVNACKTVLANLVIGAGLECVDITGHWEKCVDCGSGSGKLISNNAPFNCDYDVGCGSPKRFTWLNNCPRTLTLAVRHWINE